MPSFSGMGSAMGWRTIHGMIWFRDFGATFHPITRIGFPNVSSNMGWLDMTCLILDEWKIESPGMFGHFFWQFQLQFHEMCNWSAWKMQFTFLPVDLLIFNDLFCLTLVWCNMSPSFAAAASYERSAFLDAVLIVFRCNLNILLLSLFWKLSWESYCYNLNIMNWCFRQVFKNLFHTHWLVKPSYWRICFSTICLYCSLSETGIRIYNTWYHMLRSPGTFHGRCECQYRDARAPQRW